MKHKYLFELFGFLLCVFCLCFYLFHIIYAEAKEKAIAELNSRQMLHARQAQRGIESFFSQIIETLTKLSRLSHIVNLDDSGRHELDFAFNIQPEAIKAVTRVDASGKMVYTFPWDETLAGKDISDQKHIREILNTHRLVVSDVFTAVQGYEAIALHVPVFKGNEFDGTLAVLIDFQTVARQFIVDIHIGKKGYAWIANRQGTELYCPVPGHTGTSVSENCKDFPTFFSKTKEALESDEGATFYFFDRVRDQRLETIKKHAVYLPVNIGESSWSIVVASSEDELLASLVSFRNKIFVVIALLLSFSSFYCYYGVKAWGLIREEAVRRKAEEALRESEERLRSVFRAAPIGIGVVIDRVLQQVNRSMCEMTGRSEEELTGMNARMLYASDEDYEYVGREKYAQIRDHFTGTVETRWRHKDGHLIDVLLSSTPIDIGDPSKGITFTALDITGNKRAEAEQEKLQVQLMQAQKMEAIGTLAGGIAHNFNNVLMAIQGRASLMLMDKDASHPDVEHLKCIEEYVKNAAGLTKNLLGFARGGKYEVSPTNLNEFIEHESRLFAQTRKEIQFHEKYDKDLWAAEIDHGQMKQVLMNLYVNAGQAMPAGGEIYVQTKNVTLDADSVDPFGVSPGRYVEISVTDTGVGMDEETQKKIFTPFFTTQEVGAGSGLGLASVYGIVKNHGGFINVNSKKGEGTTFNIFLPASDKEVLEMKTSSEKIIKGEGTILIVDDEEMVIDVAEKLLENLGYSVLVAGSGKEAIEIFEKKNSDIDLVILDMILPDLGGWETYDRLKAISPGSKFLFSSGHAFKRWTQEIRDRDYDGFIQKPFSINEISKKIREVLNKA